MKIYIVFKLNFVDLLYIVFVPLENISFIQGRQPLGLCSALSVFKQEGTWVYTVSSEGPFRLVASYNKPGLPILTWIYRNQR